MNIELLKEELLRDEGLELKPYTDTVGKTTIGVGRNLSDVGITRAEAMPRLQHFKKMWAALESGRFATAADELLNSRYASQVGDRAKRMAELLELD